MGEEQIERYSFSRLSAYNSCLISFISTYILKTESVSNGMAQYGELMHSELDKYSKGLLEIYDLLTDFENRYDEEVTEGFPILRNKKSMGDKYYEDAINYLSSFSGWGDYKVISSEEKFDLPVNDFIFNGVIDLILEDKSGNIIIMDHKSKNGFSDEVEESHYKRQLYLYAGYIKDHYGKFPTEMKFNMFRIPEIKTYTFKEDEYNEANKWMLNTVDEIRKLYLNYNYFFCSQLCNSRKICQVKFGAETNKCLKEYIKRENKNK